MEDDFFSLFTFLSFFSYFLKIKLFSQLHSKNKTKSLLKYSLKTHFHSREIYLSNLFFPSCNKLSLDLFIPGSSSLTPSFSTSTSNPEGSKVNQQASLGCSSSKVSGQTLTSCLSYVDNFYFHILFCLSEKHVTLVHFKVLPQAKLQCDSLGMKNINIRQYFIFVHTNRCLLQHTELCNRLRKTYKYNLLKYMSFEPIFLCPKQ